MTARLLRGGALATRLRADIEATTVVLRALGGQPPSLATLLVGEHPSAEAYRAAIERALFRLGLDHRPWSLPHDATNDDLIETFRHLNADPATTGILVLMPLPPHLNPALVLEHVSPLKDVDGITPTNAGRLHLGLPSLRPSTPQGGLELLDHYGIELRGLDIVVIGRSNVVGRPLAAMLTQRDATVTVCHRQTRDLGEIARRADLIAIAAGAPGLLTAEMVKPGATVLDFGMNAVGDELVGDADFAGVARVAGAITPVPGGTGPITTLVLARNTVAAGFAALSGDLDHVELATTETGRATGSR